MATETKACEYCGDNFSRPAKLGSRRWNDRRYCGRKCYHEHKIEKTESKGCQLASEEIFRFMEKVAPEPNSGCWLWTGTTTDGYGRLTIRNKKKSAHRVMYEHAKGEIPDGMQIDHLCRVRCCVNPNHLEAVTQQENLARGETGINSRRKTCCPKGHPYSGIDKTGRRICHTCKRDRQRLYALKQKKKELAIA